MEYLNAPEDFSQNHRAHRVMGASVNDTMQPEKEETASSWSIRNIMKAHPTNNAVHIDDTQSAAPSCEPNRYQHDIEQAKLLRRGMKKKRDAKEHPLSESDITLALNGLDRAEDLRDTGNMNEALKISKMSIELLLRLLKADPKLFPSIDRETIAQRVQCALTDAEDMQREQEEATSPKSLNSQKPTSPTIAQAIGGLFWTGQGHPQNQSTGQSTSSPQQKQSTHKPVVAARKKSAPKPRQEPQRQPPPTQQRQPQKPAQSNQQVSKFYKSQDPMVQTIKSELYVDPSQLQNVSWNDIAGLESAKQSLQENAILPMIRPDLFTGLRKPRNILLYGPPGTGKTMLVKAVAKESQCLLFICTASSLTSKWHGEGEKLLRTLFQVARAAAPSIIFVDEMDALLSSRKTDGEHEASRRFKTEFMTQVDGIVKDSDGPSADDKHLLLISCTNCPWDIDPAVMRRFPRRIYIPLPDKAARKALLAKLLEKAGDHQLSSADIKAIVKQLKGFSGSDMASIASEASFGPIRSLGNMDAIKNAPAGQIRPISLADFDTAVQQATKSVGKKQIQQYQDWQTEQAAS